MVLRRSLTEVESDAWTGVEVGIFLPLDAEEGRLQYGN